MIKVHYVISLFLAVIYVILLFILSTANDGVVVSVNPYVLKRAVKFVTLELSAYNPNDAFTFLLKFVTSELNAYNLKLMILYFCNKLNK